MGGVANALDCASSALDRLKDLADVQGLIKVKELEADFAEKLDPSVRDKFIELNQAVARAKERERGSPAE